MGNILSQDEVDSLLDGISEGAVKTKPDHPPTETEAQPYDFSSRSGPVHLRMPALAIINEKLMTYLRTNLSAVTRCNMDVTLSSMESVRFGNFTHTMPLPASLNVFRMEPLRGFALLVMEGPLVFAFVDTFFGGRGVSHVKVEGRGFTSIETRIIEKVSRVILEDLERAWANIHPLKMSFVRSELDPKFVAVVPSDELSIVSKFVLDFQHVSGAIWLCIPYSTVEPIKNILSQRQQSVKVEVDSRWTEHIKKQVMATQVNLSCILGGTSITGRELLEMKVDDVIALDQKAGDEAVVLVEGVPKFKGLPGAHSKKKAVKIC